MNIYDPTCQTELDQAEKELVRSKTEIPFSEFIARSSQLALITQRKKFCDEIIGPLIPGLQRDEAHATASFGPLADEYLEMRQNLLVEWQPFTILQAENIITLARLLFRRRLVHQESKLHQNQAPSRLKELTELAKINREINRLLSALQSFEHKPRNS